MFARVHLDAVEMQGLAPTTRRRRSAATAPLRSVVVWSGCCASLSNSCEQARRTEAIRDQIWNELKVCHHLRGPRNLNITPRIAPGITRSSRKRARSLSFFVRVFLRGAMGQTRVQTTASLGRRPAGPSEAKQKDSVSIGSLWLAPEQRCPAGPKLWHRQPLSPRENAAPCPTAA